MQLPPLLVAALSAAPRHSTFCLGGVLFSLHGAFFGGITSRRMQPGVCVVGCMRWHPAARGQKRQRQTPTCCTRTCAGGRAGIQGKMHMHHISETQHEQQTQHAEFRHTFECDSKNYTKQQRATQTKQDTKKQSPNDH